MNRALTLWPLIAVAAMVLLGLLVGKGSTGIDNWFLHDFITNRSVRRFLLLFVDANTQVAVFAVGVALALWQRRWRLAVLAVAAPVLALVSARLLKVLFGRELGGALAYPSGHVTVLITVLGMLVLAAGCRRWVVIGATVVGVLGLLGAATTFHYFTDAIGAALLASAIIGVAAQLAGRGHLTGVNPGAS